MATALQHVTWDPRPLPWESISTDNPPAVEPLLLPACDAIAEAIVILDSPGTVTFANAAAERILGMPAAEIIGSSWSRRRWKTATLDGRLAPPQQVDDLAGPDLRVEQAITRVDGSTVFVSRCLIRQRDEFGQVIGTIVTFSEITSRIKVEEQLRHAHKMEAVGLLAAGVAHDLNNYLTTILGNVCLVRDQLAAEHAGRQLLSDCEKAGWQAADLIKQLLSLARRKPPQFRPVDLGRVAHDTVSIFQRTLPPTIAVEEIHDPTAWPVLADAGQVGQVALNLCSNARDAMPTGGRLIIETTNATAGRGPLGASREFVRLSVSDTGHGVSEDVRARMFEPFFTTKPNGKGTGLGLSVVFDIVQAHGGWIDCTSEVGTGTRLDVYFPRWRPASERGQSD
jgi:two-component system cell cycle sensor histidine kinase/response regulator CckA